MTNENTTPAEETEVFADVDGETLQIGTATAAVDGVRALHIKDEFKSLAVEKFIFGDEKSEPKKK